MKGRRLFALSMLSIVLACVDHSSTTGPTSLGAPASPSSMISDGAHGGNADFFFLPPMVPNPAGDPNYEAGRFHDGLAPRLTVEICLLQGPPVDANGQPIATDCVAGAPVKKFAAGTVQLVGMPDGHYQVNWNTRESNLDVTKYYRIEVLIEGSTDPLGFADVDPLENKGQLKNTRTGDVIGLIDDSTLPIKFRVEKSALCPGETLCTSTIVTNDNPNGDYTIVRVEGDAGPIAGALLPDGFLPLGGPQSVVFTISRVNTGANNVATGTQANPCHVNLPLQQFNGCFHFSTIPELQPIPGNEDGHQFTTEITVAVCLVLLEGEDPREPYVQLWSSDEGGTDAKPLPSAPDGLILTTPTERGCGDNLVAVNKDSNSFTRLASAGWGKVKAGFGKFFGVQTAYAVDFGIGGLTFDLSNIGPAMNARTSSGEFFPNVSVEAGATTTLEARVIGTRVHDGSTQLNTGIPGMPVTFALGEENGGGLRLLGSEAPLASQVTGITNSGEYFPGSLGSGGGFTEANWTAPLIPGSYTVTATSPYGFGVVTYNLSVRPLLASLQGAWQNENANPSNLVNFFVGIDGSTVVVQAFGQCSPTDCDWGQTTANTAGWSTQQQIAAVWDQGFATKTVTIKWLSPTRLEVTTHADFTEEDGRTDYTITEFFQRPT